MKITIRWKYFIKKDNYWVMFKFEHDGSKFYAVNYSDDIIGSGHYSLKNMDLYKSSYLAAQRRIKEDNLAEVENEYFENLFKKLINVLSCIKDFEVKIRSVQMVEDDISINLY